MTVATKMDARIILTRANMKARYRRQSMKKGTKWANKTGQVSRNSS
jgi:hypothetical protein